MTARAYLLERISPNAAGCWIWTGPANITIGRPMAYPGDGQRDYAYRVAYREFVGPIPQGHQINHHCDVPMCVNPDHLYAGTQHDNVRDMVERGRNYRPVVPTGEAHRNAFPDAVVDAVRERYAAGESQKVLAAEYGVSTTQLRRWIKGTARDRVPISRPAAPCGTRAAYCAHVKRRESPCDPCRAANTSYLRAYKAKRKAVA